MNRKVAQDEALPLGWRKARLHEVASVKTGPFGTQLHQHDYVQSNGTPIITVEHLSDRGLIHNNLPLVSDPDKQRLNQYLVREGDIVFSRVGSVDRSALVKKDEDGWLFSGRLLRLRPRKDDVHSPYLNYFFHTKKFRHHMRSIAVGGIMPSINTSLLSNVIVQFPPLPEQKAIASLLETWDTAIEKMEDLIATKEKHFKWLLKTLIGDEQNHPEWRKVILGEIGVIHSGGTPSTRDKRNWNGDISWLTPSEVTKLSDKYINSTERRITQKGLSSTTLLPENCLIVCTRATIGDCCINTVPMAINQGFKCIQPNKLYSVTFLYYAFQLLRAKLVRLSCGNTFGEVSKKDFANILISVPSLLEQRNIAAFLNAAQRETTALKQLAEQYRRQKRGLMQKLLTGKLKITT